MSECEHTDTKSILEGDFLFECNLCGARKDREGLWFPMEPVESPVPIDARIEFTTKDGGFITAQIYALDDTENLSVVFVRFIGRHLQPLTDMAMREHRNAKELVAANEQVARSLVIAEPAAEIVPEVAPRTEGS